MSASPVGGSSPQTSGYTRRSTQSPTNKAKSAFDQYMAVPSEADQRDTTLKHVAKDVAVMGGPAASGATFITLFLKAIGKA